MTIAIIVAICIGLTWISSRTSYWILKVFAGFFWWGLGFYWVANPLADPSLQVIVIMLSFGVGLACCFWAFWATKNENGVEHGKFHMPFSRDDDEEEITNYPTRSERMNDYTRRVNDAMNGRRQRK
jgi:hypothetical protein